MKEIIDSRKEKSGYEGEGGPLEVNGALTCGEPSSE